MGRASMALAVVVVAAGCTDSGGGAPTAPASSAAENTAQSAEFLDGLREELSAQSSFRVHGSIESEGSTQTMDLQVDSSDESFAGDVQMSLPGGATLTIEMIRTNGLTWIKAPAEYWELNGYTTEGAQTAETKFVVFETTAGDQIADPYNYGGLIASLEETSISPSGSTECFTTTCEKYLVGEAEAQPVLKIPDQSGCEDGACPRFVIESQAEGVNAIAEVYEGNGQPIEYPAPEEVLDAE